MCPNKIYKTYRSPLDISRLNAHIYFILIYQHGRPYILQKTQLHYFPSTCYLLMRADHITKDSQARRLPLDIHYITGENLQNPFVYIFSHYSCFCFFVGGCASCFPASLKNGFLTVVGCTLILVLISQTLDVLFCFLCQTEIGKHALCFLGSLTHLGECMDLCSLGQQERRCIL